MTHDFAVRQGLLYDAEPHRVWRLTIPAPDRLWSNNDAHKSGPHETSRIRKAWRTTTYDKIRDIGIPQGLPRIGFTFLFHFTTDARRDSLNYAETAKPIEDAFAAPFIQLPTPKKPRGSAAPGALIIPDDTDEYVDSNNLRIGRLWQDVITHPDWTLTLADVRALDQGWGGVTVVLTEHPALPPAPKTKRIPLAKVISPEIRRQLTMKAFTG